MNYIEIEIGGKVRGLKFNQFTDAEYLSIASESKNPVLHSYALIYAALLSNCILKRVEPDFSFEDVCEWTEKVSANDFKEIQKVYVSTKEFLKDIPVEKKKKVTKSSPAKNIKQSVLK